MAMLPALAKLCQSALLSGSNGAFALRGSVQQLLGNKELNFNGLAEICRPELAGNRACARVFGQSLPIAEPASDAALEVALRRPFVSVNGAQEAPVLQKEKSE